MRRPIFAAALGLVLSPGLAGAAALAPEIFEAMSEGRTLYFSRDGADYGAEQYFPGRRALWRYADGACVWGRWFPRDGLICFDYDGADGADGPQCWNFQGDGSSFSAALIEDGAPSGLLIHLSGTDTRPLDCPGPGVGS